MKYLPYLIMILLSPMLSAAAVNEVDAIEVEFLVYSGRPNPTFTIQSGWVISEICNRMDKLIVDKVEELDPKLTLRNISPGFIFRTISTDGTIQSELLVFHEQFWRITNDGDLEVLHDNSNGSSLEQILIEEGVAAGIFFREKPEQ